MTYYSNSNQIRELVMQIADEQVEHLRALETMSDVTVYIFLQSLLTVREITRMYMVF